MLQRINTNIESGEFNEENENQIWKNADIGQIMEDMESFSFNEKDSQSFKKSFRFNDFISYIERQSTILDVLLVQAKAIVSILSKYDSIEGMEESANQIAQYDLSLVDHITEILNLSNQTSQAKANFMSKLDSNITRIMEDAQNIICVWKQSPLSPFFNAVCDQLVMTWIYIDIFDAQQSYKSQKQSGTLTNNIALKMFEVLAEKYYYKHLDKFIPGYYNLYEYNFTSSEEDERECQGDGESEGEESEEESERKSDKECIPIEPEYSKVTCK